MRIVHPLAGAIGLMTILTFWTSTILSELLGSTASVVAVKTAIPWGFLLLIPALAVAGASGFARAKSRRGPLLDAKRRRMRFIAANGFAILIPCAFYLAAAARAGTFDAAFYAVQGIELIAGATNLYLLSLNFRDGLRMTGRLRRPVTRNAC